MGETKKRRLGDEGIGRMGEVWKVFGVQYLVRTVNDASGASQ